MTLCQSADGAVTATWVGRGRRPSSPRQRCGRDFSVAADGFWQPHLHAAQTLAQAVQDALDGIELDGRTAWDLYGGVGLFAEVLCRAVGPDGAVISVESDERAGELAAANLADHPQATVAVGQGGVRAGAAGIRRSTSWCWIRRAPVPDRRCARRSRPASPQVIVYVACDPAALGRDTAALAVAGYRLDALRAFDAFPQTHHVECVARYVRG